VIELSGVDVHYGARKVLDGISFNAKKGVFVGIIGPNGSGKTTLLKAISRVITPTGGIVQLDGQPLFALSSRELAQSVAVVPQETGPGFDFTVSDVVMMGRYPHMRRFSKEREEDYAICRKAMALTGITHLSDRSIHAISGGELQRVIIARALAQQPRHLLLDEATSHLDISHQVDILATIKKLSEEIAVIGVFHDLNLASYFCDEIIVIKDGKIAAAGTPVEVITPAMLRSIFDLDAAVSIHPVTGKPLVVPLPQSPPAPGGSLRVHVICGGGTGSDLLRALHRAGCQVSAGILSMNDSDYETAGALGIFCITEPPFCPITDPARKELLEQITAADAVIMTATPVGEGNLDNLRMLAQCAGTPVLFLAEDGRAALPDYTGGKATAIIGQIAADHRLAILPWNQLIDRCTHRRMK
jgi:iron complex transport system ATP-binding protein